MRRPQLQSHVTHRSRAHVSIKNGLSPHSQDPWPPKLGRMLDQDEGVLPKKSRDTSIVWSREESKSSYFLNHTSVEM